MAEPAQRIGIGPEALRLDGQVALVTGASRNIGAAIAGSYAAAGADVLMVARGAERLESVAEAIRAQSPDVRVETTTADVGAAADVDRLAGEALARFGRVDVLVNNAYHAGLDEQRNVLDVSDATWDVVLAANVLGPLRLTRTLARAMLDDGRGGAIINLVSGSGLLPNSAPRHALCPGLVAERGTTREEEPYERLIRLGAVPMMRIGAPDEIAGAAVYLASPAASYTTGELLVCNGGRHW